MTRMLPETARLTHTLVFHDGPQLVLLESNLGTKLLAVAVERDGMGEPFFACEVRPQVLEKYFSGKADLRYVFSSAGRRRFYFFELSKMEGDTVTLERAPFSEIDEEKYWPEVGFFARSHTHPIEARQFDSQRQTFKIDGAWEPGDFSRFYNKIEDLYAFVFVINRLRTPYVGPSERAYIRRAIDSRFWQGGGSYVGFYDDLATHVQDFNPISVERIAYASPGEIVLRGEGSTFSEIDQTLQRFEREQERLRSEYSKLNSVLAKEKVRRKRATTFSSEATNKFVQARTLEFAKDLGLSNAAQLGELSGNPVVFCKVVLSFYRRARDLYLFRAEGRVQVEPLPF